MSFSFDEIVVPLRLVFQEWIFYKHYNHNKMKKTLLTILCLLTALCSMAQSERTYTEPLVISTGDGEPTEPQEASIVVVDNGDQTINFVLKNFMLGAGADAIAVGNVVVNNLPVTKGEDGLDHVFYDGIITITPGDLEGVSWLGPLFGSIPIVLEGKMNEEKLYVTIDINMGMVVTVLLGTDDFPVTRVYTEPVVISMGDGEPSEPYEANITVVDKGNQTIDFVLKNFMLSAGDEAIAVGNICIENIPVNRQDDGLDHFFYQGVITIESGDLEDVAYWIGPAFGDIPIAINGKMNEEKLFASIDINMGVSVVTVQVGTDAFSVTVVKGDMNGDTVVDIADAVSVLNMMADGAYTEAADINGDGKIDIADFVGILDIMAGQ